MSRPIDWPRHKAKARKQRAVRNWLARRRRKNMPEPETRVRS